MKHIFASLFSAVVLMFAGCAEDAASNAAATSDSAAGSSSAGAGASRPAAASQEAANTPQAVFEAFKQAVANDDWETATGYLTDESQSMMAFTMLIGSGFVAAFDPDAKNQFEELFKKHGLDPNVEPEADAADVDPQQAMLAITAPITDKPKFIGEVSKLMDSKTDGSGGDAMTRGALENVRIDGDTATATVVGDGTREPIEFVRVDGAWRIQMPEEMLSMSTDDSTVSFSGDASFGGGFDADWSDDEFDNWQWDNFEEPELAPAGEIPLADFNAGWQVSMNESNVPAGDLLKRLAEELRLEWVEPEGELPQLSEPVSINVSDISRLEAADRIAQQIGLYPKYLMKKMTVAVGPRPHSVGFAGPFLVEVGAVDELVPAGATQLTLRIHAHGLNESAVSLLRSLQHDFDMEEPDIVTLHITEQTGTSGKSLEHPGRLGIGFAVQHSNNAIQWTAPIPLLNTTSDVASIETLKGELSFVLPTEVETLTFESLETGTKLASGDATFELKSATGDVQIDYQGIDGESLTIVARDSDGNPLDSYGTSAFGSDDGGTLAVYFEGEVASADVVIRKTSERVRYPFELRDIPLPRHAEQPDSIPELTFEGDTPLMVEFIKFTKNEFDQEAAEVRLSNGSNRDLTGFAVLLHYLDESGEELDDFPFSSFGTMVPAGETATDNISTAFMPDGTKSVRIEVTEVTFMDLTTWSADDAQ